MKAQDKLQPKGFLQYRIYDGNELIYEDGGQNLVVSGGRDAIVRLIGGNGTGKHIVEFGVGEGSTSPVDGDTALTNAFIKAVDNITSPTNGTAQVEFTLTETEANTLVITEFGLFCDDGTLFARKVVPAINKTSSIRIEATWKIIF